MAKSDFENAPWGHLAVIRSAAMFMPTPHRHRQTDTQARVARGWFGDLRTPASRCPEVTLCAYSGGASPR